jgi:hypothetical membrane protein
VNNIAKPAVHMSIFRRGQIATGIAVALAAVAIARYPGGTPRDHSTQGYRATQNFLSDLGMTVAYSGVPNRLGAACFIASLALLVIGLGGCVVGFFRQYSADPKSRGLARAAAFVALVVCLAFAGVAATPENLMMGLHVQLTFFAFRAFLVSAVLFTLASRRYSAAAPRVWLAWSGLTIALAVYVWIQTWGPHVRDPGGLETQVIAQKLITIVALVVLLYQSVEANKPSLRSS